MATKIFTAGQFRKNKDIIRRKDLDFTDDGTRFNFYSYKGTVGFHIARWRDMVFICIRPDYTHEVDNSLPIIPYEQYKNWGSYNVADKYNGVKNYEVNVDDFIGNLELMFNDIKNYILNN